MKRVCVLCAGLLLGAAAGGEEPGAKSDSPCAGEAFRAFDFWVGDWEVRTADGRLAGRNRVEAAENGCVIVERWTGAAGMTGMSMNYLDGTSGQWVQLWTDSGGGQVAIRGGPLREGTGMRLEGTIHYVANERTADFRGLWTVLPDGRLRQLFEESSDGGRTWKTWFEGFYSPAGDAPAAKSTYNPGGP